MLDEPTSHLDIINHQLESLSLSLTTIITVVVVFHDFNMELYFYDRLILMSEGRIIAA